MTEELHTLQSLTPLDVKALSREQRIGLVQKFRNTGAHNANLVLFLATDLLAGGSSGLTSSELYDVYEQVVTASLECGKIEHAKVYLNLLEKRFGRKSLRVSHLRGLCLEAEGRTDEAKQLYEQLKKEAPTNDFVIRRLCAILKHEGKYHQAIRVLTEDDVYVDEDEKKHGFLEVHRGDSRSTYLELSHLYCLVGNLEKAIFYAEEYMVFEPDSYFIHVRLGELYYMKKDLKRCATEYAQSLLLNSAPNNSRAAYGLWQVSHDMLKAHQSGVRKLDGEGELTQAQDLREMASDTLRTMYAGSAMLFALDAFLQREA